MRHGIAFLALLALATAAFAYPNNPPMGYAGNPPAYNSCVNCHSSYPLNSGNGYLELTGLPGSGYTSGTTYHLTVTLADPGQVRWGFELTAIYQSGSSYLQAGDLIVTDPTHTNLGVGSGSSPDYLRQTTAGTYNGTPGPTSWNFDWMAPDVSIGTLTFYFAGAACNGTGGTGGDYCYTNTAPLSPAGGNPSVSVTMTPVNPPIQIPASGGSFDYTIAVANNESSQVTAAVWCDVTLPNGNPYGPVLGPVNLTMPGGFSSSRLRSQAVPAAAPAGTYSYNGYVGIYPNTIWDQDSFTFEKLTSGDANWTGEWSNSGQSLDGWMAPNQDDMPVQFNLSGFYPNPFNPTTTLSLNLPTAAPVNLAIYDVSGRRVATLADGWRDAGLHEFTFDASGLSSGMYLYRLKAGDFRSMGKMMLVK